MSLSQFVDQVYFGGANSLVSAILKEPLSIELVLAALAFLLLNFSGKKFMRKKCSDRVMYKFGSIKIYLQDKGGPSLIGVSQGLRRFVALPYDYEISRKDIMTTHQKTETLVGQTSGGITSGGQYVPPERVTFTRYLPEFYDVRVGSVLTFIFLVPGSNGIETRKLSIKVSSKHDGECSQLLNQFSDDVRALIDSTHKSVSAHAHAQD